MRNFASLFLGMVRAYPKLGKRTFPAPTPPTSSADSFLSRFCICLWVLLLLSIDRLCVSNYWRIQKERAPGPLSKNGNSFGAHCYCTSPCYLRLTGYRAQLCFIGISWPIAVQRRKKWRTVFKSSDSFIFVIYLFIFKSINFGKRKWNSIARRR